tara:strand:- start:468 stop:692 length:225 start_codon:yes stop_codon:yes gene_type:complete
MKKPKPKKKPDQPSPKIYWAVMKAQPFSSLVVSGYPLQSPTEGPHGFIPVFDTREQAVEWAGSDENVEMMIGKQ